MNIIEFEKLLQADWSFVCEGMFEECGMRPAREISCRTQYANSESNVSPVLCEDCAKAYNDYWDEMWNEYYSGCLYRSL
jgi:hypothetical protein